MAITLIGLHSADKKTGESPTGKKVFLVESDTQITDDINQILDFSDIPAYDATWDAQDFTSGDNLRVRRKSAEAMDVQEGFIWMVTANYEPPTGTDGQDALDPRDRPWDWSYSPEKQQVVISDSLYNANKIYPGSLAADNINLAKGAAIQNTAGLPFSDGVLRTISRQTITLTKYVSTPNGYTDFGVASWEALDAFQGTVNDQTAGITILGIPYAHHELLMDEITRAPVSENGFDVIKVTFRIVTDTVYTHTMSLPSQGMKQLVNNDLVAIWDDQGNEIIEPRLLDKDGVAIPVTGAVLDPIYINFGVYTEKDWTGLSLPTSIP